MSAFSARVAALLGIADTKLERLAGGDLSEVILLRRPEGRVTVAKGGPAVAVEASMLRTIAAAGVPAPGVEGELDGILLLESVKNDNAFSPAAWRNIGAAISRLHSVRGESYGWPADYALGTVKLDNRPRTNWVSFWGEQRLLPTVQLLDRPWRRRIEDFIPRLGDILPSLPPPALLHGDLWSGNILVEGGALAALIDPACYYGHAEADLAMLTLFGAPDAAFWDSYGSPDPGWEERRAAYQLFPALVHMRLFGAAYGGMVDRLLARFGA